MSIFLERQKVRRQRAIWKMIRRVEPFLLSITVVLGGLAILYGFYLLVFFGPYFSVRDVTVEGGGEKISVDEVARLSGVEIGDNLFWLDVTAIHRRLLRNPWIRATAVRRRPPHTLWIYVEEYVPAAIISAGGLFYVDERGVIFKEIDPSDEKDYPVFTGLLTRNLAPKTAGHHEPTAKEQDRISTALHLVHLFDHAPFAVESQVAEINYHPLRGFSVMTDGDALQIVLGKEEFEERFDRLRRWSSAMHGRPGRIHYIMTSFKDRVVVRYRST